MLFTLYSVSHVRNGYWFSNTSCPLCTRSKDPRVSALLWRQFEAFDCTDLDSIHNDGERHIPYLMLWPDAERSKMAAWANNQAPVGWSDEGMLAEQIHQNTPDTPDGWTATSSGNGRHMGDSSSAFVIELLELYRWGNDTTSIKLYYETVVKGVVRWQLNVSAAYGVPYRLQTTYDLLGFPRFEIAAYNSVFHIATLAAAAELADAMGDDAWASHCRTEQAAASTAFDLLQWNATLGGYNAGSNNCTKGVGCLSEGPQATTGVFADSFYAQVLAFSAGLGTLVAQPSRLLAHLTTQLKHNCIHFACANETLCPPLPGCPNGMVALTGPFFSPAENKHWRGTSGASVWEMSNPNHASLGIQMGQPVDEMMSVFEGSATSYSRRFNDQWNTAGLKDSAGNPTCKFTSPDQPA